MAFPPSSTRDDAPSAASTGPTASAAVASAPAGSSSLSTPDTARRPGRLRRVLWSILIVLLILVGAIAAALRWWLPDWSRQQAETALHDMLGTPVHIGQISLELFDRRVSLHGLRIGPEDTPLLRVRSAQAQLALESLWRRVPIVERVDVQAPELWIHRLAQGSHNFTPVAEHLAAWQARQPPSPPQSEPARYALHNLRLSGGRIHYADDKLEQRHEVEGLDIGVPFLSNLPSDVKIDVLPTLSATVNGSALRLGGQTRPFAPDRPVHLNLKWQQADLKPWAPVLEALLADSLPLDLKDGLMDTDLRVDFAQASAPQASPHLKITGSVGLQRVDASLPKERLDLKWAELQLQGLDLQPLQQRYQLDKVGLRGLDAAYALAGEGPSSASARRSAAVSTTSKENATTPASAPASASSAAAPAASGTSSSDRLHWRITELGCEDCRVTVRDDTHRPGTTLTLEQARLSLGPLSEDFGQPQHILLDGRFASAVGQTASTPGTVSLDGQLRIAPLSLQAQVGVKDVDLRVAQPYLAPHVNLTLAKGRVSTAGRLALDRRAGSALKSSPTLSLDYQGRLTVQDLRTLDSVNGAEFVAWQSLDLQGLKVGVRNDTQVSADLGRVGLDGLQARLILNPDGRLNTADIVKSDRRAQPQSITTPKTAAETADAASAATAASAAAPAGAPRNAQASATPMDLRWQEIRLQRGTVAFSDFFVKPNYSARLTKLQGSLSALSARTPQPARLSVAGALDDGAPLRIAGTVHPLGARLYTDIEASARGIALPRLSTYAARYAGYGIEKGSMSVTVHYKINEGKLEAENQIFLDQLTFGEKIESPTATKLPVLLAVSLLKNRRGEIDLRLPISGTLDDPQFSVGGIIWKMVLNIIGKAVTAPFSLLMGSGSSEDGRIDFAAGSPELTPATRQRLDELATKLADRPQLKLEVTGLADTARDASAPQAAAAGASVPTTRATSKPAKPPAPLTPAQLQMLADERAMRVMAYLSERLPAERVVLSRARAEAATPAQNPVASPSASAAAPSADAASATPSSLVTVTGVTFQLR